MLIIINGDICSNCQEVILFNYTNYVFSESVLFWPPLLVTLQIFKKKMIWIGNWQKIIWKDNKELEQ